MLVPSNSITDWRDLQEKTRRLFSEMGYEATVSKKVKLAGRGKKEIDVFVTDPNASYNKIYLIECKFWKSRVPQEVVHAFKTIMEEAGANTGFIISKAGFQSGAREAAKYTNIKLLTFNELQHMYGNEWFRKQREQLEIQVQRLRFISSLHFDQWSMVGFHNNMVFRSVRDRKRLSYFHRWVLNLILAAKSRWPESYAGPKPVKLACNPDDPDQAVAGGFTYPTVRDYFAKMTRAAKKCADEFEKFEKQARARFELLPQLKQDSAFVGVISAIQEELPIRVLKGSVSDEEYYRLVGLSSKKPAP